MNWFCYVGNILIGNHGFSHEIWKIPVNLPQSNWTWVCLKVGSPKFTGLSILPSWLVVLNIVYFLMIHGITLPIDFHILQRGRYTTNKISIAFSYHGISFHLKATSCHGSLPLRSCSWSLPLWRGRDTWHMEWHISGKKGVEQMKPTNWTVVLWLFQVEKLALWMLGWECFKISQKM